MLADANRAKDIFLGAVALADPAARAAFADRACGADPELRRWVEDLLAAFERAAVAPAATDPVASPTVTANFAPPPAQSGGDVTADWKPGTPSRPAGAATAHALTADPNRPPATANFDPREGGTRADDGSTPTWSPSGPRARPDSTDRQLGRVVGGKYTLTELIGEGGMGSVYLAQQTNPVKRAVAVKLIKAGVDSRGVLARFDAERQALALMEHPNIARVYDGGTTPDGMPFFAMELVRGVPLTRYCDEKRLPPAARLDLFVQVCRAVQHAHQKGIIHRDLKPANILVTEVDGRPTPKVIDFGVAKATEQRLTDMSFADVGVIVGTPVYMSPEQAEPATADIDTRTDVYALGVVLYELLTGTPPIRSKDLQRGAILEMLRIIREVEPPHPSTRASSDDALPAIAANRAMEPGQLLSLLRGDIDAIVMKAIDKDRERRYDSANGFADDVLRFLANEPVVARAPTRGYRLRKFVRRNRAAVAVGAAFLALLAGGAGAVIAQWREAVEQRRLADEAKARADEAKAKAEANYAVAVEQRLVSFEAIGRLIDVARNDLPQTPGTQALQRKVLSITATVLKKVLGNPDTDVTKNDIGLASVYEASAQLHAALGDIQPAVDDMQRAVDLLDGALKAAAGKPDQHQSSARLNLAYMEMGLARLLNRTDPAKAKPHLDRARELFGDLGPDAPADNRLYLSYLYRLTAATVADTDLRAAAKLYEDSLRLCEELIRTNKDEKFQLALVDSHRLVGRAVGRLRDPAGAERHYRQAARVAEAEFAKTPTPVWRVQVGTMHDHLGDLLLRSGKPAEARLEYKIVLEHYGTLTAADPKNVQYGSYHSSVLYSLGLLELRANNPAAAAPYFRQSLAIRAARVREKPEREAYIDLMWSLARDSRPKEAADMADLVLKKYGTEPSWLVDTACCFAICSAVVPADAAGKQAAEGYAVRAVRDLEQAIEKGYRDVVNLETEPDLDPLRGRDDFKRVLADAARRAK